MTCTVARSLADPAFAGRVIERATTAAAGDDLVGRLLVAAGGPAARHPSTGPLHVTLARLIAAHTYRELVAELADVVALEELVGPLEDGAGPAGS